MRRYPIFAVVLSFAAWCLSAQAPVSRPPAVRTLVAATDLTEEAFSNLVAVGELASGRVVTLDIKELVLGLIDPKDGRFSQIGRRGAGPGEYRRPGYLFDMGDEAVLVGDGALRRLLAIDANGTTNPSLIPAWPLNNDILGGLPAYADRSRRAYFTTAAVTMVNGNVRQADSVYIVRVAAGSARTDTLARIALAKRVIKAQSDKSGNPISMNIVTPPIAVADDWTVFRDGTIAVVRSDPYRVDWVDSTGRATRGPELPFTARALRDDDKRAFLAARAAANAAPGVTYVDDPLDAYVWPALTPAFSGPSTLADPLGRAWVRRFRFAKDATTRYDVIGRDGRVSFQVEVPGTGRVVGFGRDAVYFTRVDDDGLQYLRRAPLPR